MQAAMGEATRHYQKRGAAPTTKSDLSQQVRVEAGHGPKVHGAIPKLPTKSWPATNGVRAKGLSRRRPTATEPREGGEAERLAPTRRPRALHRPCKGRLSGRR